MENRTFYARSPHFGSEDDEIRRLHLVVDIWDKVLIPVYCFIDSKVHNFAFNDNFGDYGSTIILQHSLHNNAFYSLYGHLSLQSLDNLFVGKSLARGDHFCDFGVPVENRHCAPHLHLQLMTGMGGKEII